MSFTEILREIPKLTEAERQELRRWLGGYDPGCLLKTFLNRSPLAADYSLGRLSHAPFRQGRECLVLS